MRLPLQLQVEEKQQKVWRKKEICILKKFISTLYNICPRIVMANNVGCYIAGTFCFSVDDKNKVFYLDYSTHRSHIYS